MTIFYRKNKAIFLFTFVLLNVLGIFKAYAAKPTEADVVVIVDTSISMIEQGMDPERSSLLVTKLFADIVPGNLAVIRLLDLDADKADLPRRDTGKTGICTEGGVAVSCPLVEATSNWSMDAHDKKLGALIRPQRGDSDYKTRLESHLDPLSTNSIFELAFQSAQGVFDSHNAKLPRTVIWLSDGRSDHEDDLKRSIAEIKSKGIVIEPLVFGKGELSLAQSMGLKPLQVHNPAEIMKAFANAFRRIVEAPYQIDHRVSDVPNFEIKPNVQEVWVVVYGDTSLADVGISHAGSTVQADYAADSWHSAGAYKVAYLQYPEAGQWHLDVKGGGADVAYAVIQRSELSPVLIEPQQVLSGTEVLVVAGINIGNRNQLLKDAALLTESQLTADIDGKTVQLFDNGQNGDKIAGDGLYSGLTRFSKHGQIPVRLHLQNSIADIYNDYSVQVTGVFNYQGSPILIDLGQLTAEDESCRPLIFKADHQGEMPFSLKLLQSLPTGHRLFIRIATAELQADDSQSINLKPNESLQVCLKTSGRTASSQATGEDWLNFAVVGSAENNRQIIIRLQWQVQGLTFWQLWGWLILLILAILIVLFIILGFILPYRFRAALAVTFVPERDELDEQTPQPIKQWKGVGAGFYRHARAFFHSDYRISGKSRGALAGLFAVRLTNRVKPMNGNCLFKETLDGDWDDVPVDGCICRAGDVYRIGNQGPYFRISVRG